VVIVGAQRCCARHQVGAHGGEPPEQEADSEEQEDKKSEFIRVHPWFLYSRQSVVGSRQPTDKPAQSAVDSR